LLEGVSAGPTGRLLEEVAEISKDGGTVLNSVCVLVNTLVKVVVCSSVSELEATTVTVLPGTVV
jgi:hypothetical protein